MTRSTPQTPPPRRRVPAFVPVPLRARRDGWTPLRQAEFLGHLAETRSVAEAARRVNMARETAYRLRKLPGAESFNAAWDAAMGLRESRTISSRKVTGYELWHRAYHGTLKPIVRGGRYIGTRVKTDTCALLRVIESPYLAAPDPAVRSRKNFADPWSMSAWPDESFTSSAASARHSQEEE
ncbi:hypothetical protein [Croceibacterium aestuarii]|uniref:hypothetical protein n=1 Tax=Croceibacterium aestuarii TaxID=3064139 RepID=UPI00272E1E62|nr:hypothetical protein [Croceibacterium sp. D39]